jgi:hypothetical protein
MPHDQKVKNSPHYFGVALDVIVGDLMKQIEWATVGIGKGYFTRCGFYPEQNTMHFDRCSFEWMEKYNGTPSWVKWHGEYTGFAHWREAAQYAMRLIDDE